MKRIKLSILLIICTLAAKISFASNGDTLIVNPNPFDSVVVIQFTISNNDSIWLDIYNITGNTIKSYYNGTVLSSGSYTLNFNGDTLPNGVYFVRLKINSNAVKVVKLIKNSSAVGLKENNLIEHVTIFPNPTSSIINIIDEQNQFQNSTIDITNSLGQDVINVGFTNSINVSVLPTGYYFINITLHNGTILHSKFIKE